VSTTQTRKAGSDNKRYTSEAKVKIVISDRAVAVAALVLSMVLLVFCYGLWSRYDLLRMFYEDIKTELIRTGHDPHPHMPKENP
jgi:hypothetical protein